MRYFEDIYTASLYYTGGGVYVFDGELSNGTYFYGSLDNGAVVTDYPVSVDGDYDESTVLEYLTDAETLLLAKAIYRYKVHNQYDSNDDNYDLQEFKRIINYYAKEIVNYGI